jgi:hypothetical protein
MPTPEQFAELLVVERVKWCKVIVDNDIEVS